MKMKIATATTTLFALILIGGPQQATAQSRVVYLAADQPQSNPTNSSSKAMTVDDVVKLSKAGLSDDLIIQQIKQKGQSFDLTADQIIQLKTASVTKRVMQVMINPASNPAPAAPVMSATVAPAPADRTNHQGPPNSDLPSESGVYTKEHGKWIEVLPEIVN